MNSLTLGNGEEVAQVRGGVARGWLRALDIPQWQKRVVITGREVRQAQHVMALLRVRAGAVHTAVQDLRADGQDAEAALSVDYSTHLNTLREEGPTVVFTSGKPGHAKTTSVSKYSVLQITP